MALTFPSSPTNGQIYLDTITGNRYIYNSNTGSWVFSSNSVGMSVSSTPPSNVGPGSMWYNREIGRTFLYYNDGDSSQWVETVPSGSIDTTTIASYVNPIYASLNTNWTYTNTAYTFANIAVNTANTAFPNTPNVSFNGSFNVPNGAVSIGTNAFPVGKFHVSGANGEISRFTATGASGGYHVSYFDNSTPWYFGSAKATIAGGNINDLYFGSGSGTTNNLIFGTAGTERLSVVGSNGNIGIGTSVPSTLNGNVSKLVNVVSPLNSCINFTSNTVAFGGLLEFNRTGRSGSTRYAQFQGQTDASDGGALVFYTAAAAADVTERMRIDSAGRVTKPSQPFFMGYPTTDYSAGSMPTRTMDVTAYFNNGNHFNATTDIFTCPITGWYRITWGGLQLPSTVTSLKVNGSRQYSGCHCVGGSYFTLTQTVLRSLAAGDTLEIEQWNGGGYYSGWWLWSVELVG